MKFSTHGTEVSHRIKRKAREKPVVFNIQHTYSTMHMSVTDDCNF